MNSRTRMSPGPGAGVVPELGLDVVDELRKLPVGTDFGPAEVGHHLLVGHGENEVTVLPVLEPRHFGADGVVATRPAPDFGRVDDRHGHFLPADPVHFLAQDVFDPGDGSVRERQVGIQTLPELPDETGPQQEPVALGFNAGRRFTEREAEMVGKAHQMENTGGSGAVSVRRSGR